MRSDGSLRITLGWTISAMLFAYAPQIATKPFWVTVLMLGCALVRWLGEVRRTPLTPAWIRTPIGLVCFLAILQTYGSINGVGPGSTLLCVMAALKLLETRSKRDLFVILFICLFLILATFLTEQHLWSLVYLVCSYGLTMAAWMAVSRQGSHLTQRWYVAQARKTLMFATPLFLAMWILFPRVPGPFWAIPNKANSANTGLSSTMSPGDISQLSESQAVAFRVRFQGLPPSQRQLYWRAIVMEHFDGRSWSANKPSFNRNPANPISRRGEIVTYKITAEPTQRRWLYALDMPVAWSDEGSVGIYPSPQQTLQRRQPVDELFEYEVTSALQYVVGRELSRNSRTHYTTLPPQGNEQAREFARQLLQRTGSAQAMADELLRMFNQQQFFYTLSPPPLGRNSVDDFLFSTRSGFCEHYASAFAFLMRAAGIPTRVIAGYQGGTQNPLGDFWTVRQSDAHAWTEIWLPERGWVRVDPTAAVAPERIEKNLDSALRQFGERGSATFALPLVERLKLTWDMANARWDEWVLGFGSESQSDFMQWLGLDDPDWRDLTALLAIALVCLMTSFSVWLWYRNLPPRGDAAQRLYRQLQRRLGLPATTGETPLHYAERASAAFPDDAHRIRQITHDYLYWRYAGQHHRRRRVAGILRKVRWRFRSRRARQRAHARGTARSNRR
ncbi:MAG: DUF3488 and transglutaminase-like domain-containing protein [Pseudomonadota bacterium]